MSGRAEFDYAGMAREALDLAGKLKAGLEKVRSEKPTDANERLKQRARALLLEDEYYEQMALYRLFIQRAEAREKTSQQGGKI